jgi:hypothetical protein
MIAGKFYILKSALETETPKQGKEDQLRAVDDPFNSRRAAATWEIDIIPPAATEGRRVIMELMTHESSAMLDEWKYDAIRCFMFDVTL